MGTTTPPGPVFVLRSHTSAINHVRFTSSKILLSADVSGRVCVSNMITRRTEQLHMFSSSVLNIVPLNSGSSVIIQEREKGMLRLYDVERLGKSDAKPTTSFQCDSYTFTKAVTSRYRPQDNGSKALLLSPMADSKCASLIDLSTSSWKEVTPALKPIGKAGMCMSLQLLDDLNLAYAGYENGQVSIFDLRSPSQVLMEANVFSDTPVLSFDVDRTGKNLYCVSSEAQVKQVNVDTSGFKMSSSDLYCNKEKGGYAEVRLRNTDGKVVGTAGWDNKVRLFRARKKGTASSLAYLSYHTDTVQSLDFAPETGYLATGSSDKKVACWDIYSHQSNTYK